MTKLTSGAVIVAATLLATGPCGRPTSRRAIPRTRLRRRRSLPPVARGSATRLCPVAAARRSPISAMAAGAGVSRADQLFLEQGDRGIGNN